MRAARMCVPIVVMVVMRAMGRRTMAGRTMVRRTLGRRTLGMSVSDSRRVVAALFCRNFRWSFARHASKDKAGARHYNLRPWI